MSAAAAAILKSVLKLSTDEQRAIIDAIENQFPEDDLGLDPEFVAEIQRRSAEFDAGAVKGRPWSEIRAELLAELDNAP